MPLSDSEKRDIERVYFLDARRDGEDPQSVAWRKSVAAMANHAPGLASAAQRLDAELAECRKKLEAYKRIERERWEKVPEALRPAAKGETK